MKQKMPFIRMTIYCMSFCVLAAALAQNQKVSDQNTRRLADYYERLGRYEIALDHYLKLVSNNPRDIAGYAGAKRCLVQLNELNRLEKLVLSLQQKRRDLRYEIDLAEILYLRGHHREALSRWQQLIEDNSRTHQAYAYQKQIE